MFGEGGPTQDVPRGGALAAGYGLGYVSRELSRQAAGGGKKNTKTARYDLIPHFGFDPQIDDSLSVEVLGVVEDFWERNAGPDDLEQAATALEAALGGYIAARRYLAEVFGRGALKYGEDNYKKGYPWSWNREALHRHLNAVEEGEWLDNKGFDPSYQPHYAHAWWHLYVLSFFARNGVGTDDRPLTRIELQPLPPPLEDLTNSRESEPLEHEKGGEG